MIFFQKFIHDKAKMQPHLWTFLVSFLHLGSTLRPRSIFSLEVGNWTGLYFGHAMHVFTWFMLYALQGPCYQFHIDLQLGKGQFLDGNPALT